MQEYRDDDDGDDDSELDLSVIKDYLGFALRALRLRPLLALGIFVGVLGLAYGVLRTLPRTYHVESKMMAQKDTGFGKGNNPWGPDPLKGASDVVKGHEQLVALVKQLDLINWWQAHLAPAQKARLWLMDALGHQTTEDEWMRILVETLDTKMQISPGDGTVTFAVDWTDGVMAARLVDTAEQNFLERRHVMEISTIAESVGILEGHAAKLRQEIEELTAPPKEEPEDKDKKPAAGSAPKPVAVAAAPKKAAHRSPEMDAELARQKVIIEAKQRAINDLEDFRQRRVLELQANLSEQHAKYTDQHPIIVGIQQNIASFSHESPQVTQLRSEVKALQEAYNNAAREADAASGETGTPRSVAGLAAPPSDITSLLIARPAQRDPAMEAQITYAVNKYSEIRAQISTARIDLDLAQAAFRYRYTVVVPAEPPKGPSKPKVPLILAAAAIAGLLFGLVATVIAEIRSGRLVTRFQVERVLNLPILAELSLPQGEAPNDERP